MGVQVWMSVVKEMKIIVTRNLKIGAGDNSVFESAQTGRSSTTMITSLKIAFLIRKLCQVEDGG